MRDKRIQTAVSNYSEMEERERFSQGTWSMRYHGRAKDERKIFSWYLHYINMATDTKASISTLEDPRAWNHRLDYKLGPSNGPHGKLLLSNARASLDLGQGWK